MHAYVRFTHPLTGHELTACLPTADMKRIGVAREKPALKVPMGNRGSIAAH